MARVKWFAIFGVRVQAPRKKKFAVGNYDGHEKYFRFVFASICNALMKIKKISSKSVTGRSYGEGQVVCQIWGQGPSTPGKKNFVVGNYDGHEQNCRFVFASECNALMKIK